MRLTLKVVARTTCGLAVLLAISQAGCNSPVRASKQERDFSISSGDAFDLLRHLQQEVATKRSYFRNRRDEAQEAVDHLRRSAANGQQQRIAQSLEDYFTSIEEERAVVDRRHALARAMQGYLVDHPMLAYCTPRGMPNQDPEEASTTPFVGQPACRRWLGRASQLRVLAQLEAQRDEEASTARSRIPIKP